MAEPIITCPHCQSEIALTESLAAPLISSMKLEYESKTQALEKDIENRTLQLQQQEANLKKNQENLAHEIDQKVTQLLQRQKEQLVQETIQKTQQQNADALAARSEEVQELQTRLQNQDEKLQQAQKAQVDFLKKQRDLEDQKRELDLTIEKRVQKTMQQVHDKVRKETEESFQLKFFEKEQQILSMQKKIEELKQKAEQGSQQLQGEVQELILEETLRSHFFSDKVEPVAKGEFGGDILQSVLNHQGNSCGLVIWESKRTKHWNDGWLTKLKDDQRAAKADIAVIVSQALPQDIETFGFIDGVWVIHPRTIIPVATMLRDSLIKIHFAHQSSQGQQTKTEMIYSYLTGPRFRQRVEAIVEAFTSMQDDLNKERKVITKQWTKREEQINRVMQSTIGMYGDLQGIAGQSLQEIEGLELNSLLLE